MIHVPPAAYMISYMHPPGGAGLLIRPEVMFHVPPGCFHDVLYAPRGLHIML